MRIIPGVETAIGYKVAYLTLRHFTWIIRPETRKTAAVSAGFTYRQMNEH